MSVTDGQDPDKDADDNSKRSSSLSATTTTATADETTPDAVGDLPENSIDNNNNNNCSNVDSKSLANNWWREQVFLPIVATLNTPPYTMVLCLVFFCAAASWFEKLRPLLALYGIHCVTDATPRRLQKPRLVQRVQKWCNNARCFRWTAEYFPCRLHHGAANAKTTISAGDGPYIFVYHPHGVIGMGGIMALVTNACGFDAIFPGVSESIQKNRMDGD